MLRYDGRLPQLPVCFEDHFEFRVVGAFRFVQRALKVSIRRQHLAEAHERSRDFDIHQRCVLTAEHTGKHGAFKLCGWRSPSARELFRQVAVRRRAW